MGLWGGTAYETGNAWVPAQEPRWQPPTGTERALYQAKLRNDWSGYLDVLADSWLYFAVSREPYDRAGRTVPVPFRPLSGAAWCLAVHTEGTLPDAVADPVFFRDSLRGLARTWPDEHWWLAVNPGTPCEAYLPASAEDRVVWLDHFEKGWRQEQLSLRTLAVGAPLHGPVAHGLALTALLRVKNGELWNTLSGHGVGYDAERERLSQWWGVTDRASWLEHTEELLRGEMLNPRWEFALQVRRELHRSAEHQHGRPPGLQQWREAAEEVLRNRIAESGAPSHGHSADSRVAAVQDVIGTVSRYEARFRADGLLAADGFVRSVLAWDYGRAASLARWGLTARYCTLPETEQLLLRAGRVSQTVYGSWAEFSAAHVLGRCLHFDDEEFGSWYTDMLTAHRILTTEPTSPWRNIPFA